MKKRRGTLFAMGFASVAWLLASVPALAQDMTVLADEAFGKKQRPPAVFAHEDHNEKAGLDDCAVCHHVYRDGVKVEDESSEDMQCSDCHSVQRVDANKTPLMKAYHEMCQGCHKEKAAGPITCGECHPRGGPSAHGESAGH